MCVQLICSVTLAGGGRFERHAYGKICGLLMVGLLLASVQPEIFQMFELFVDEDGWFSGSFQAVMNDSGQR